MSEESAIEKLDRHKVFGYRIFTLPAWFFCILALICVIADRMNIIPNSSIGSLLMMIMLGVIFGEIGDRLPFWKDYIGGGTVASLIGGAVLVYFNILNKSTVTSITSLMNSFDFIGLFAALLVGGSIMAIDRKFLLRSFIGYLPTVVSGIIGSFIVGLPIAMLFGKSIREFAINFFLPIMCAGTGSGAVPMSQIYESGGAGTAGEYMSIALPVLTIGLMLSIIAASSLSKIGNKYPGKFSGMGKLSKKEGPATAQKEEKKEAIPQRAVACGFLVSLGVYMLGVILQNLIPPVMGVTIHAFAWMVIILVFASVADVIPKEARIAGIGIQSFFANQFSWVVMMGVGVVYINFGDMLALFTLSNLLIIMGTMFGAAIGALSMGYLVGFYPLEAMVTGAFCMTNSGGAGDVAVLGAANRLNLLPWAQISSRLGGGLMLIIGSIIVSLILRGVI